MTDEKHPDVMAVENWADVVDSGYQPPEYWGQTELISNVLDLLEEKPCLQNVLFTRK